MKTAIIAGASGLIGNDLIKLLIENTNYEKIIAIGRKPLSINSTKLIQIQVDFENLALHQNELFGEDVFCCLGTTIRKAGSESNFKKVDFDYCMNLANVAKQNGAKRFYLVSALGANSSSTIFYNHVKGKLENALIELNFESLYIFRPSLLLGKRTEFRIGEKIMQLIFKPISKIMIGGLRKYAAIESKTVAKSMDYFATKSATGIHIISNEDMLTLLES
jgi:uncharacterized protein YbjT (DUF2867 family)